MYYYCLGYLFKGKHQTEWVEGIVGKSDSSDDAAYRDAVRNVRLKCGAMDEVFDEDRLITNEAGYRRGYNKGYEDGLRSHGYRLGEPN